MLRCRFLLVFGAVLAMVVLVSDARATLVVTNGDFGNPTLSSSDQLSDVTGWYDANAFVTWQCGPGMIQSDTATGYVASNCAAMRTNGGFLYQSLGTKDGEDEIPWSFFQGRFYDGNSSAGFTVDFYSGTPQSVGDTIDIAQDAGVTHIGVQASFAPLGNPGLNGRYNSGTCDISSVADGAQIWMRIGTDSTVEHYAPIDNIRLTTVPEPSVLTLLATALVGLVCYAWRKRK